MFGECPRKPVIPNAWFQQLNMEVMIWAALSWYSSVPKFILNG